MLWRDKAIYSVLCGIGLALSGLGWYVGLGPWLVAPGMAIVLLTLTNLLWWQRPFFPYDCILSASSLDGLHWVRDGGVRVDVGGRHRSNQVYYPDVVACAVGWRMYYRAGGDQSIIASATSAEGLDWQGEAGIRLGLGQRFGRLGGSDAIAGSEGACIYFAGLEDGQWGIYRSESVDGLNWEEGALCLRGAGELPHLKDPAIIAYNGSYRLYFTRFSSVETRIGTSTSFDGRSWSPIEQCQGCEGPATRHVRTPNVVALDDGRWRMYFAETPGVSALESSIVSAVSLDGLLWSREEGVRLAPGGANDPHGVFCPDVIHEGGEWKMYYGGYWKKHLLEPYTLFRHRALQE